LVLCKELGPSLIKNDTSFRTDNSIERRVEIFLVWLGSGNGLQIIGDLFGVAKYIVSQIIREFCNLVKVHLQKKIVTFLHEYRFYEMAKEFEALHDILYIIGTIDGFHISIVAPVSRI
jgi:hypothetical protein